MPAILVTQLSRRFDGSVDIFAGHSGLMTYHFDDPYVATHRFNMIVEAVAEENPTANSVRWADPKDYFRETRFLLDNDTECIVSLLP